jgi:hypothetical protein
VKARNNRQEGSSTAQDVATCAGLIPDMNFHGVTELGMAVAHQSGVRIAVGVVDKHLPHTPNALGGDVKPFDPILCTGSSTLSTSRCCTRCVCKGSEWPGTISPLRGADLPALHATCRGHLTQAMQAPMVTPGQTTTRPSGARGCACN